MESVRFKGPLNMEPIGCTETSVVANLRCVTSKKREDVIYTVSEADLSILCLTLPNCSVLQQKNAKAEIRHKQILEKEHNPVLSL